MRSRIVTAKRDGACNDDCGQPIRPGDRIVVMGEPDEPPALILRLDCANDLRVSLVDQFEREKRRRT